MRIDAHMHLWRLARGDYDWISPDLAPLRRDFEPEGARPLLEACEIDGVVLVQAAPTVAETRFLLDHAAREPWVRGVVGWVDMAAGDAPDVLGRLARDRHLVGIRPMIHDINDLHWMLRPDLAPAFRTLVELDLTFDALVRPPHLANLLELLTRHENLRTVVDHAAKPYIAAGRLEPWASDMAALARHTRAFCKLSGLITEARPNWTAAALQPYVDVLLESFGPERLLWGSDWPVMTLAGDYRGWHETARRCLAGLDPLAIAAVFGGNAALAYRL
jgi:L-fuconolactonase